MIRCLSALLMFSHLVTAAFTSSMYVARHNARKQIEPELSERDSTTHSFTRIGEHGVECDGALYGDNIELKSCLSAMDGMSRDASTYSWGPRGGSTKLITPLRILSRTWTQWRF